MVTYVFQHLECEVGYIGPRCKKPCPPPTYGPFCGLLCHCNQSECDNIRGCETGKILSVNYPLLDQKRPCEVINKTFAVISNVFVKGTSFPLLNVVARILEKYINKLSRQIT